MLLSTGKPHGRLLEKIRLHYLRAVTALSPEVEEKRLLTVSVTVKFVNGDGDIKGKIRVLQGTTMAGLLHKILSEYR